MEPWLGMALLWGLFAGAHIGLATGRARSALATRLGERGYGVLFSLIAACCYSLLITYYAQHRFEGSSGLALGRIAALRWALMGVIVVGVMLMVATFAGYARSPYAVLGDGMVRSPRGIERVTRHPFFVGLSLVALAHCLLATHLVGTIFVAGFAVLALAGAWHQDRKLLARRGQPFADYLAATSMLPFGAIVARRQELTTRGEMPWGALLGGAALAAGLRLLHGSIFAYGGALVVAATVGGAAIIAIQDALLARRRIAKSRRGRIFDGSLKPRAS
jgi:uncharacterized membrane protein